MLWEMDFDDPESAYEEEVSGGIYHPDWDAPKPPPRLTR